MDRLWVLDEALHELLQEANAEPKKDHDAWIEFGGVPFKCAIQDIPDYGVTVMLLEKLGTRSIYPVRKRTEDTSFYDNGTLFLAEKIGTHPTDGLPLFKRVPPPDPDV